MIYSMKIIVTNLKGINDLQEKIMIYLIDWTHKEDHPISRKAILKHMEDSGVGQPTTINAIKTLCIKGYIRPAVTMSNTTSYVVLRSL